MAWQAGIERRNWRGKGGIDLDVQFFCSVRCGFDAMRSVWVWIWILVWVWVDGYTRRGMGDGTIIS